jgi:hypothetical protein
MQAAATLRGASATQAQRERQQDRDPRDEQDGSERDHRNPAHG